MKNACLRGAVLALLLPAALPAAAQVAIHGFVSQGYFQSDANNWLGASEEGSFQMSEAALNFSTWADEKLRVGAQLYARDLGPNGDLRLELDWAFGDYRLDDRLGLRAGKFKVPSGLYNDSQDLGFIRPTILLPSSIYDPLLRDVNLAAQGVGVYGNLAAGGAGDVDYQAWGGTMNADETSSVARLLNDTGVGRTTAIRFDKAGGGALTWNTPVGLKAGASLMHVEFDADLATSEPLASMVGPRVAWHIGNYNATRFYGEYERGALLLSGEYGLTDFTSVVTPAGMEESAFQRTDTAQEGWYVQGAWRFNPWLQAATYYSVYYPDRNDKDGSDAAVDHTAWQKDWTVALRFDCTESWLVKVEGHVIDGTGQLLAADNPQGTKQDWFLFLARTTFTW